MGALKENMLDVANDESEPDLMDRMKGNMLGVANAESNPS
jgi:hypothetical protein